MPLASGTRLGPYEIGSALGVGGMGEVYRAHDTKLGRDVAIKVLPQELSADEDRLDRFEREARLLAQLNHANIATLHGFEEDDGERFLVMELVEGETLAERIARGPIPVDEALPMFVHIAEGMESAHGKGVIHRDLKPANIKLGPDGRPKILDFGLAKAFDPVGEPSSATSASDASQSPTLTKGTELGAIMGTAAYMSPEQAKGHRVDKRTDVFAFGCVLYECLTGKKAFEGSSTTEILGAILHEEPDWGALPANTPPNVRRQLKRCFEKDARRRTRDMGDVALELADTRSEPSSSSAAAGGVRWRMVIPVVVLAILFSYLAGTRRSTESMEVTQWSGERLGGPTVASFPVVSPDEALIAFLVQDRGLTQVAVMRPGGSGDSRQLTHDRTRGYANSLAWSPDSSRIYFDRSGRDGSNIFSVSGVGDTEERLVLDNATDPRPLPDGTLLAVRANRERLHQLIRFRPGTNDVQTLPVILIGTLLDQAIEVTPAGDRAVVAGRPEGTSAGENHLYLVDLETGAMRRIATEITLPLFDWEFPLSVSEDEAYFVLPAGDLYQIVAVRLDGTGGVRPMLSLTRRTLGIDVTRDGTLYLDQIDQPSEILRLNPRTGGVEHFPVSTDFYHALPLAGDRFLVAPRVGNRDRLKLVTPPEAPVPFLVDNDEESRGPLARVGEESVAFVIGPATEQQLALASTDGRLQQRIPIRNEGGITGLAASPDGTSLFYATNGIVYRVPSTGGESTRVSRGDEIAVDPSSGDLVILRKGDIAELVRVSASGEMETSLTVTGEWSVYGLGVANMMGHSVSAGGRLVVRTMPPASWMFPVGTLDGRTGGSVTPLLYPPDTDMMSAGWDREGRIVAIAHPFRSELWRFRPLPR